MGQEDDTLGTTPPQERLRGIAAGLRGRIEALSEDGLEEISASGVTPVTATVATQMPSAESVAVRTPVAGPPAVSARAPAGTEPSEALAALRDEIGDCRRCKLCEKRTQIVFGVGSPRAKVMFVGEGPGEEEDRRGEPFVGRAGQLLTDIITKGMGLSRDDVYIANVVKCRPPGNRNPESDEIAACAPFLRGQIETIRPQVIVALGKFAAQTLAGVDTPITRMRGRWHDFQGTRLMPTFHPSYLLRNPAAKREVWEDIQTVMREVGLPAPSRGRS